GIAEGVRRESEEVDRGEDSRQVTSRLLWFSAVTGGIFVDRYRSRFMDGGGVCFVCAHFPASGFPKPPYAPPTSFARSLPRIIVSQKRSLDRCIDGRRREAGGHRDEHASGLEGWRDYDNHHSGSR